MRKLVFLALATLALSMPTMTSCSSDTILINGAEESADTTKTDTTEHDHEEEAPARIVLTLSAGHFHGTKFHGDGVDGTINLPSGAEETVMPKFYKAVQTITLVKDDNGYKVAEGSDSIFRVLSEGNYITPYGLWITYIAADGDTLNSEFGGEMEHINAHQHFFTAQNARPTADGVMTAEYKADSLFTYTYMDTDPWNMTLKDSGTKLIGSKMITEGNFTPVNPVGLKGFFTFKEPRTRFDVRVRLKHFDGGSKFVNGVPYAYNKPAAVGHDELSFNIPFIVFASRSETEAFRTSCDIDWDTRTVTNYDEFTAGEKRYVESLRAAYGCTLQEILWDFYLIYDNGLNAESNTLWF